MQQRNIRPVADNRDKQRTYTEQMRRYKRAMTGEFYLEAMMIDYALLEDRLHAMLYHMGFLADRMDYALDRRRRPLLVQMVTACFGADAAKRIGISNITGKMKIVRSVLHWSRSEDAQTEPYPAALRARCSPLEMDETLDAIADWCGYRNEIVHALMNKNMDSLTEDLRRRAEEGMALVRLLDAQVRAVKRDNRIRRSAGLETP